MRRQDDFDCRHTGASCIRHVPLLSKLPETTQHELLLCAVQSSHPKGTILVHEGDPIDSVLIVQRGKIKIFRIDADGEEYVLDVLHDGQAIWHGIFLDDRSYHYSVACLTELSLCTILRAAF